MKRGKIFEKVAGNHPGLNHFDLSYTNTSSMRFGLIYPVQCDEVYPGDYFKLHGFVHAEIASMVSPLMSDIQMYVHTFFVPYRLLYGYDNDGHAIYEKWITGGEDGDYDTPLPSWTPNFSVVGFSSNTIWDYIGNPVAYDKDTSTWTPLYPKDLDVCIAPKRAYNFIWNEYYRSVDLNDEVDLDNEYLLNVNFRKDYFTSAALFQQRGTAPALPVDIDLDITFPTTTLSGSITPVFDGKGYATSYTVASGMGAAVSRTGALGNGPYLRTVDSDGNITSTNSGVKLSINNDLAVTSSEGSSSISATTFTPSDLRLAFAIQRMMELSARSGYRFIDFLNAHWGVHPSDERLDRPEYIGGFVTNVTVSPSIQTSSTDSESPQGNKVGVANIDCIEKIGNYRVLEYGLIMTLVNIVPKPIYSQGINRQWLRQTRFDVYNPALAFLSEQNIYGCEIYTDGLSENSGDNGIFGYQAHFNELRCKDNRVSGAVREQFDYWTLARKFAARPALNADFLKVVHEDFNRIFAVQDEDPFVVSFSNIIDAYRPLPAMGVPGLIDHVYGGF